MRQHIKNQCLDTLGLLAEAHGEIARDVKDNRFDDAFGLLDQCQQGAISVGELIEQSEGAGAEEVRVLEDYCEMLWQYSEEIKAGGSVDAGLWEKKLKGILSRVSTGIRDRIPAQREVVFLPYKASMWDSLETVWQKLDADPSVNALVIPIPYFDKNPDGSAKEMHYEGDQFPKDVPVTDYREYNLESNHPDAIYIHNPYDEANQVTSVHPDYYSSRLKNLTDELVYIPYFVLWDVDPENEKAVKSVEHYILLPGVINAHRVIVQSEKWRKVYINALTGYSGEKLRSYWEKKIDGSGSPKLDRVKNLKAEDYQIPEEWVKVIERSDGSRRKVIFYNTGVSALLKYNDGMLEKIVRVLGIFKDNSDDVVLLWRPHPLMEATIASMRPKLLEKYKSIVDEYRADGWGIYDDTPELDRAIAVSDAYYGDMSSVVQLYKETGKPIMIQNAEV